MNVDETEHAIDAVLRGLPLRVDSLENAQHVLLSAVEDRIRAPLIFGTEPVDLTLYLGMLDGAKYALKYALAEVMRRGIPATGSPPAVRIDGDAYREAISLLDAGRDYQAAVAAFTAYRAGKNICTFVGGMLKFRPADDRDVRFRVRDALESMIGPKLATSVMTPINAFIKWMVGPPPPLLLDEARQTQPGPDDTLACRPSAALVRFIFDNTANLNQCIPAQWVGSYRTGIEIARVLHALVSMCLAHTLLINSGAYLHGVRGMGLHSVLLRRTRGELIEQLVAVSGVGRSWVQRIVAVLLYGSSGAHSPDPALQPLIGVGQEVSACPLLVCSSDVERNFLTLLARISKKEFDAASHVFEAQMTQKLKAALAKLPLQVVYNRALPGMKGAGEVDVLLLDSSSKMALLLELWWTIPPSEAQEVLRRESAAAKKGNQASKKLLALRTNLPTVLTAFGLSDPTGWTSEGLLITDGFLPSKRVGVPVVTRRTFESYLQRYPALREAVERVASEEWLPVLGEHFENLEVENSNAAAVPFSTIAFTVTEAGVVHAASTLR